MRYRKALAASLAVTATLAVQLVTATANAAPVTTLHYSSTGAPDYVTQIDQAAANWNAAVTDVRLVKGGTATIVFAETDDGRGSYTNTDGHGHGRIYLDKQQVAEGFAVTRIAAHELGHNLGLPDHYSGPCSELMSGHGPGTSCTNAVPDAAEAAKVQQDWADGFAAGDVRQAE
ncbi:snapalysin [Amycolatopsis sacchari]|uniref:Extracellular small neutral protease n=1 Tax=Amycolatopsis sacchari TaxID=115433 RepID=A0A1I3TA89_9PSEU|nr:snapalysin family zinc-dependent metalloprotease [Amycolatopsis sacchari]SFJ66407.1 snapalysin [Amycolatopsis sacchari]